MEKNKIGNKKPKICHSRRYDGSLCGRPLYDDMHCIFHSKDVDRKKKEFNDAFWKEFERQKKEDEVYDFSGFIFPKSISFEYRKFDRDTYFVEAKFQGDCVNFNKSEFTGKSTYFSGAKFLANTVNFKEAKFLGNEVSFGRNNIEIPVPPYNIQIIRISASEFLGDRADFSSAQFKCGSINFSGTRFSGKYTDFSESIFYGNVLFGEFFESEGREFYGAKFESDITDFRMAEFKGDSIDFSRVFFSGEKTMFSQAVFEGETINFSETKYFKNINFGPTYIGWGCGFYEGAIFKGKKINFRESQFLGEMSDFTGTQFLSKDVDLNNAVFKNVKGIFEALIHKTIFLKKIKYKIKDFKFRLGEESAVRYPIVKRMTQDAWYLDDFKKQHPRVYFIWWLFADCGKSILRWAAWSLGIAIFFAILFMIIGQSAFEFRHHTWFSFFYYSIATFTTLGFGDITPTKWFTEIFVTIEVILGYIMLGGLISIFAVKLARRS